MGEDLITMKSGCLKLLLGIEKYAFVLFYYFSKFYLLFSLTLPIILNKNSKFINVTIIVLQCY